MVILSASISALAIEYSIGKASKDLVAFFQN
jgi:hypothetical protein